MKLFKKNIFIIILYISNIKSINEFIIYSPSQIEEHKIRAKEIMLANLNLSDSTYQMNRALKTISGTDCDYIPKVKDAGEIFFNGELFYQLMHNGVKIVLNSYYDVQWATDVIYGLKGHHEPQEEKCFYEVLKYIPENATMLELGSFWAYYSLWFAFSIKGAKNYLIEPDPKRLEVGKKNFALNNKVGIFKQGCVGKIIDEDLVHLKDVEQVILEDFIEKEKIEHIHILHADIQGSEYDMLKTLKRNIYKIDYFFISTHGYEGINSTHLDCISYLKNHNFIILAEHTHKESCSGDGLIVAKRNGVKGPDYISIQKY